MRYPASRREFVTRRAFVVTTASLLAALAGQACRPTNGERGSAHGGSTSETAPAPARQAEDQTPTQGTDAPAGTAAPPDLAGPADSTAQGTAPQLRGLVYLGLPDPDAPETIRAQPIELPNLIHEPGQPWRLRGQLVEVLNFGVLVDRDPASGKLVGAPMGNAETTAPELFEFQPRNGGPLPWDNEAHAGADNAWAREAARFGEVMVYFYADRVIRYANELLAALGERPLPFLRVVVNAHSASRLPGYRQNDGEYLDAKTMQPLAGGHYRLPTTRAAELPFRHPMSEMNPTGEVHLGPGNSY